jgi:hypothetical protein
LEKKAAQGSEPELLIPISVVDAQLPDDDDSFIPQLALCGDINQRECTWHTSLQTLISLTRQKVGPIVVSEAARAAELEVSLLERLFERPLYCNYAEIFHRQDVASYLVKSGLPFTNLVKVWILLVLTKQSGDNIIL